MQNPNAVPSSPRLRKAFLRPGEDTDGAKLLDFYLPEEEDVSRVDEVLKEPTATEELRELNQNGQIDDDEHFTVSPQRNLFSESNALLISRTCTTNGSGHTRWQRCKKM